MAKAIVSGMKDIFTLHDLKRKGVADFEGDKFAASGHRLPQTLQVYEVLPATVAPTESAYVDKIFNHAPLKRGQSDVYAQGKRRSKPVGRAVLDNGQLYL